MFAYQQVMYCIVELDGDSREKGERGGEVGVRAEVNSVQRQNFDG